MRRFVFVLVFIEIAGSVQAQLTQKIQQIAKLELYIHAVESGYKGMQTALKGITTIKQGHLNLDMDYFAGLTNVNPAISGSNEVSKIRSMSDLILTVSSATLSFAQSSSVFGAAELSYIKAVLSELNTGCSDLVASLNAITKKGAYQMSDDQRISQIDALMRDMAERYAFCTHFAADVRMLALQRLRDNQGAATLLGLY